MSVAAHVQALKQAMNRVNQLKVSLDFEVKHRELKNLENEMTRPGFWDNQETAQKVVEQKRTLGAIVEPLEKAAALCEDVEVLCELGQEDASAVADDIRRALGEVAQILDKLEFQVMLGGEHDHRSATLTVTPGAGGIDAADWAEMLLKMYVKWAEDADFDVEELDYQSGEEAGIRTATVAINGPYAYGRLRAEQGVHRLVRISPFDGNARRQTSFASVEVVPDLPDDINVDIVDKDLRIDTFRASGAGGQHVNKTDSAIRITHLPTGIVVSCQNQRSQHKNKAQAMKTLKAKLYQLELAKREEELAKFYGDRGSISWGNQIRSYVLHPYQMVKDLRTGRETSNVQAVLGGDIDDFIESYLKGEKAKS
ncbi:MAG: peptide chain release factor 2 [Planctomycetes bacterium]|nr:peptide chain release factor 2 [Planctomycetota bacterium]